MIYKITPYKSVNNFNFGETPSSVKKKNGAPYKSIKDNIQDIITEERAGCELVYEERRLSYITLNKNVTPMIGNIQLFSGNAVAELKALDQDFLEGDQYIIFRNLGVCIGGLMKKKIPEGKIVNVFSKDKIEFFEFVVKDDL